MAQCTVSESIHKGSIRWILLEILRIGLSHGIQLRMITLPATVNLLPLFLE
jgi:hypothetical protein